jgi:hypothetical protein
MNLYSACINWKKHHSYFSVAEFNYLITSKVVKFCTSLNYNLDCFALKY